MMYKLRETLASEGTMALRYIISYSSFQIFVSDSTQQEDSQRCPVIKYDELRDKIMITTDDCSLEKESICEAPHRVFNGR